MDSISNTRHQKELKTHFNVAMPVKFGAGKHWTSEKHFGMHLKVAGNLGNSKKCFNLDLGIAGRHRRGKKCFGLSYEKPRNKQNTL